MFDIQDYLIRQIEWSLKTFGHGMRTIGLTKHIEKECQEIRLSPNDLEEWVDVIILALEGFWRAGGTKGDLTGYLTMKQNKNLSREWPPIKPQDEPVEHIQS